MSSQTVHHTTLAITMFLCLLTMSAYADTPLDFTAEEPFAANLLASPTLLHQNHGSLEQLPDGRALLVGAAGVVPEDRSALGLHEARRRAEILARAAVLEALDGINLSTWRDFQELAYTDTHGGTVHLERFIQSTRAELEGRISQLPVVGTWWTRDRTRLHVAVGALFESRGRPLPASKQAGCVMEHPEGRPLFLNLVRTSTMLCTVGGVRGFVFPSGRKALVLVGAAPIQNDPAAARRIARVNAQRAMLAEERGIAVSSVSTLTDVEEIRLSGAREDRVLVSDFLELRQERVAGLLQTLPVVAEWRNEGMYHVVLGMMEE